MPHEGVAAPRYTVRDEGVAIDRGPTAPGGTPARAAIRSPARDVPRLNHSRCCAEARADVEHAEASRVGLALERQVVFRPHLALHHVEPSRLHAEELGVLIRDDLERQPIEDTAAGAPPASRRQ